MVKPKMGTGAGHTNPGILLRVVSSRFILMTEIIYT